jgi:hypothetical protein
VENPVAVPDRTAEREPGRRPDEGDSSRIERLGIEQSFERVLIERAANGGSQGFWRELDEVEGVAQKVFHAAILGLRLPPRQLLQSREPECGLQRLDIGGRLDHRMVT